MPFDKLSTNGKILNLEYCTAMETRGNAEYYECIELKKSQHYAILGFVFQLNFTKY